MTWYEFLKTVVPKINHDNQVVVLNTSAITQVFLTFEEFTVWLRAIDVVVEIDGEKCAFQKRHALTCK